VLRIFTDTVARWYRQRQADRGLPGGQCGSVTAIHRASSDLRCDPHFHCLFLDGVYAPDGDGKGQMFHPAPAPTQRDVEQVVERVAAVTRKKKISELAEELIVEGLARLTEKR
jgi:hypothetical protein